MPNKNQSNNTISSKCQTGISLDTPENLSVVIDMTPQKASSLIKMPHKVTNPSRALWGIINDIIPLVQTPAAAVIGYP